MKVREGPLNADMNPPCLPTPDAVERALSILLADGAEALRLAQQILDTPRQPASARAMAQAIRALCELRDGDPMACLPALIAGESLGGRAVIGDRAADLLMHVRAQWHRHEGQQAQAEALLRPLHERAATRPAVDAYLTAAALGTVVSIGGDDDQSLNLFYQAVSLARLGGQDALLVNALNNLGSYQLDLYNLEDAEPLLQESLAGALRLGSRRQIIYAAGNLVQCLCLMGRSAEALTVAREQLMARIRADDVPALHRDEEIAHALLDNGLVDEAAAVLAGQIHVDPLSNELATARVLLNARIALAQGRRGEALRHCLDRHEQLTPSGAVGTPAIDRIELMRLGARAAEALGQHALAYRLLNEAFHTHMQLLGRAARSRQLSLQITHGLQQAEWERDKAQQMASRLEALNGSLQAQIAENERLHQLLRAQALEDPLTGAYNRRHLLETGSGLLSLMKRRGEPLSVIIIDLDHFKQVNDHHGHEAGDRVLRAFADLARMSTRAEDLVCRYGGEEFVLLMPGARGDQAAARTLDLLQRFCSLAFDVSGGTAFTCSFSAGIATSPADGDSLQRLIAQADQALYAAKAAGRACVHRAGAGKTSSLSI